jgi:hypothetical protein
MDSSTIFILFIWLVELHVKHVIRVAVIDIISWGF